MNKIITFFAAALLTIPTYLFAAQSRNLESVLLEAASEGQTDIVKSFLDNGANIEFKNELGATPLIFASTEGHSQVVALLLDRGANVNAKTTTGITPLMAAASGGYAEVVKLLLAKGADVSARDQQGRTALSMAEAADEMQVYDLLKSADKSSASQERRAASQPRRSARQQSEDYSDSSADDSRTSGPVTYSGQESEGPMGGQPGGLLNDPVVGQIVGRVLGGRKSGPGNVAALQNVDPAGQMQAPAQGGKVEIPAPAQGGKVEIPAPAQGGKANPLVPPSTIPDGLVETRSTNPTTGETQVTITNKDPKTGASTELHQFLDKSGKIIPGKGTVQTRRPTEGKGEIIVNSIDIKGNGLSERTSTIVISAKGDSSKTTNFDPKTGFRTSETTVRPSGSTSAITYNGNCPANGAGCTLASAVDTDPKTGKATTTKYDATGKVVSTQVSDIPKDPKAKAATLKADTKPKNLVGDKLQGLAAPKPGLTGDKEKIKAAVQGADKNKPLTALEKIEARKKAGGDLTTQKAKLENQQKDVSKAIQGLEAQKTGLKTNIDALKNDPLTKRQADALQAQLKGLEATEAQLKANRDAVDKSIKDVDTKLTKQGVAPAATKPTDKPPLVPGGGKEKIKAEVLGQIQDKSKGDLKVGKDKVDPRMIDPGFAKSATSPGSKIGSTEVGDKKLKTGAADKFKKPGETVGLNPQPLPPKDFSGMTAIKKPKPGDPQPFKEKAKIQNFTEGQKEKLNVTPRSRSVGQNIQSQGTGKQKVQTQPVQPFKEKAKVKDWGSGAGSAAPVQGFR